MKNLLLPTIVLVLSLVAITVTNKAKINTIVLPKSEWECTMRDVRPKHLNCTQYELKDEYK